MPRKSPDLTGQRFGHLSVLRKSDRLGPTVWECLCDCGKDVYCPTYNLTSGNSQSCGCWAIQTRTTHGLTKSRVYVIWKAMHQRCSNPNAEGYWNYGGRGIEVCDRWHKFECFLEDMGHPPPRLTLERVENNGNYEKSNCKWATMKEQLNNRRANRMLTYKGRTQSLTMWAEEFGMPPRTLTNRLDRAKMSIDDALTAPIYAKQRGWGP